MNKIYKYSNYIEFLKESKSISDSCITFVKNIEGEILNFLNNYKNGNISKDFLFNFDSDDFKVKDLLMNMNIIDNLKNFNLSNKCNGLSNFKNATINNDFLENTVIKLDINLVYLNEDFIYYIKSVILHEILHCLQFYKHTINGKFRPSSWSIATVNSQIRKYIKTPYISYINDLIYISLNHEMAAQLHQYYYYRKENKEYKRIFDNIKSLDNFVIKNLSTDEVKELEYLKKHIYNSILSVVTNKKYIKYVGNSLWNETDINIFIQKLDNLFKERSKYIKDKIKRIDKKIPLLENLINYKGYISLPSNFSDINFYNELKYDPKESNLIINDFKLNDILYYK